MEQFIYLPLTLSLALPWLYFYIRYDLYRREMIFAGLYMGIMSLLTGYFFYAGDWWMPHTFTSTKVGFEDFFLGFFPGGAMAVAHSIVKVRSGAVYTKTKHILEVSLLILVPLVVMFICFFGFHIPSAYSTFIAVIVALLIMYGIRPGLIKVSLISGVLGFVVTLPFYLLMLFFPSWIQATYLYENLSGITLLQIPVEEFLFWIFAGMIMGPFYEFYSTNPPNKRK